MNWIWKYLLNFRKKITAEEMTFMNTAQRQSDEDILHIVTGWQNLEGKAISFAYDLMRRTTNPFTKMITDLIVHDSEKHRHVQQMIIDTISKEALHISPDELNELAGLINRHVAAEEEAIKLAQTALPKCKHVSTHFLLSYLIDDEKKHHSLVSRLDELKLASVSTSASAAHH